MRESVLLVFALFLVVSLIYFIAYHRHPCRQEVTVLVPEELVTEEYTVKDVDRYKHNVTAVYTRLAHTHTICVAR